MRDWIDWVYLLYVWTTGLKKNFVVSYYSSKVFIAIVIFKKKVFFSKLNID